MREAPDARQGRRGQFVKSALPKTLGATTPLCEAKLRKPQLYGTHRQPRWGPPRGSLRRISPARFGDGVFSCRVRLLTEVKYIHTFTVPSARPIVWLDMTVLSAFQRPFRHAGSYAAQSAHSASACSRTVFVASAWRSGGCHTKQAANAAIFKRGSRARRCHTSLSKAATIISRRASASRHSCGIPDSPQYVPGELAAHRPLVVLTQSPMRTHGARENRKWRF